MENKIIKLENIKNLFFTKRKLPKKECLLSLNNIFEILKFKIPKNKYEEKYFRNLANVFIGQIRKQCKEHHILWIDPVINKTIFHGFSQKREYIENSIDRNKKRLESAKKSYTEIKLIDEDLKISQFKEITEE